MVVKSSQVLHQQLHELRNLQIIVSGIRQLWLDVADNVMPEVANETRGELGYRGIVGKRKFRVQQLQRATQSIQRISALWRTRRRIANPGCLPRIIHRQRSTTAATDKRPARPRLPHIGGLQQESAGTIGRELAVGRQRRFAVRQNLANHGHDPMVCSQFTKALTRGHGDTSHSRYCATHPDCTSLNPGLHRRWARLTTKSPPRQPGLTA